MIKSPHWVWIRGLAREHAHWGSFEAQFRTAFPDRNIIFLDLQGSGDNLGVEPPISISEMLPFLRGQLQHKIGKEKFNVFSVSLGSMIAMEWMHQFPDEIESSVMINPSSKKHGAFYERLRFGAYSPLIKALTASSVRKREMEILKLISNRPEIYKETAAQWTKVAKERPMTYTAVLKQLAAGARYSPPDKFSESIRVLMLVSLGDRMVEPKCGLSLAEYYGWKVKTHAWAGHDLSLDDPEWVINALREMISV